MSYLKRAQWLTDKYILVMLFAFPLFTGLQGYGAITQAKERFFTLATLFWLAAVLVFLALALLRREKLGFAARPAHLAAAGFVLWAAVSALYSPWWDTALKGLRYDGLLTQVLYVMIFFGVSLLGRPRKSYVWAMAAAVTLSNIMALLQLLGLDPLGFYPEGTNYYDKYGAYNSAFLGTIGNVGLLGQYLCIVTPVLTVFGLRSEKKWEKYLLLAMALLCLVIAAFSQAEAAYMGLMACVLVGVPVMLPEKKARKRAAFVMLALVLLGLVTAFFWPGESGTLWELSRILHGDIRDSFGSSRVQIWRRALELFTERPLLGGGPGTFGLRADIVWERFVPEINDVRTASVTNTHNSYLGYLVDLGLPGLQLYLVLIACSAATWLRRRFDGPYYGALGCAMLCALVQDFFCLNLCLVTPMMWVLWGLLESGDAQAPPLPEPTDEKEKSLPESGCS